MKENNLLNNKVIKLETKFRENRKVEESKRVHVSGAMRSEQQRPSLQMTEKELDEMRSL